MCTLKVVDDYVCMQAQFNTYAFVLLDTCTKNRWKTGTKVVLTIISSTFSSLFHYYLFISNTKVNILNWAKSQSPFPGACTSCNSDPYKVYVWEVWQQQCLEGDSIACFKKHLNGLLPGYQRKKNDKPIFWHFSLDHFFFQIHKAHFSPLEHNKTQILNGF